MDRTAFTEPQCLYSTSIPLLPLWAIRPVQSLSACRVQLYLYLPNGPYGLYSASVSVQYIYNSPPLWSVRPVQSPSFFTVNLYLYFPYGPYSLYRASVLLQFIYISTPPLGRTAFTEPQFLYSKFIPLLLLWAVRPVHFLIFSTLELYLYSPYGPFGLYRASVSVQVCIVLLLYLTGQNHISFGFAPPL